MFKMLNVHFKDAAPFFSFCLHSGFLGLGSKTASLVSSALAHFSVLFQKCPFYMPRIL